MDKQNPSPTKRFRSDLANIRSKQISTTTTNNNNKQRTTQVPYRNSNNYQQQNQVLSSSPIQENFEESNKQIISDIDLNMNCVDEQLSDVQMAHHPVKVSYELFEEISN